MSANIFLSITIPTYNRADYLDSFLGIHIPVLREQNIAIYIADNASTDHTEEVVKKWQVQYPYLNYHRNHDNLGMDGNFEVALGLPDTEYVWLFGDTYQLPPDAINYVLNLISQRQSYDAFVFNLIGLLDCPSAIYKDRNKMLVDIVGVMSCVACMIYSRKMILATDFLRYKGTFFSLTAIIFEYVASSDFSVHWSRDVSIENLSVQKEEKKNWSNTRKWIDIGVEGWVRFLFSLPAAYTLDSKFSSLKSFGRVSSLLSYKVLMLRRIEGNLSVKTLITNGRELFLCAGFVKICYVFLICLFPVCMWRQVYQLKKLLK